METEKHSMFSIKLAGFGWLLVLLLNVIMNVLWFITSAGWTLVWLVVKKWFNAF